MLYRAGFLANKYNSFLKLACNQVQLLTAALITLNFQRLLLQLAIILTNGDDSLTIGHYELSPVA